jgi:DNA-binding protein YbaB
MSFVSFPTDPNIMNQEQLNQLKENYCEMIIDGMDMDCLVQMCHDLLMDAYKDCSEDDIKEEILDLYDEEMLEDLMP